MSLLINLRSEATFVHVAVGHAADVPDGGEPTPKSGTSILTYINAVTVQEGSAGSCGYCPSEATDLVLYKGVGRVQHNCPDGCAPALVSPWRLPGPLVALVRPPRVSWGMSDRLPT